MIVLPEKLISKIKMNSQFCQILILCSLLFLMCSCGHEAKKNHTQKVENFLLKVAHKLDEEEYHDQSVIFFCESIKKAPNKDEIIKKITDDLYNQEKYHSVNRIFQKCLTAEKVKYETHEKLIKSLIRIELYEPALLLIKKIREFEKNSSLLNYMGVCYDGLKNHDLAQEYYLKALKLSPGNRDIIGNQALSVLSQGREEGVILLKNLKEDPDATIQDIENYQVGRRLLEMK